MPDEKIDAWDTKDQQSLPAASRRKAWRPLPNLGIGLFVDKRARESRRRACRAAVPFMTPDQINRQAALRLCRQVRTICRWYWANWDYDNQPTYGDIKTDVRKFRKRLIVAAEAFKDLQLATRRVLNGDIMFVKSDRLPRDYIKLALDPLRELQEASDRVLKPNYKKIKPVAVPRCCDALAAMWEEVTGKSFSRTKRNDSTGKGLVFRSEGPRCLQAVIAAIDPAVGIDQVISWMVEVESDTLEGGKK